MKIYNSLTRRKETFKPIKAKEIGMYVCGVTVYDDCHLGHARSLYIFNVINNYLKYRGYKVKFVRNITDIDDKIINKAKELGISSQEVAKKFIKSYHEDLKLLKLDTAAQEPKATENIKAMVGHIKGLIDKGYAYEADSDVYFSVRKFKDYGKLSGQSLDQMIAGTRKEPGGNKKDPLDFALWKKSKEGEPSWDSPWGKGRPGWHIECSTMSRKYLETETLDIHAGGRDLIFPHHENEIAQSEALTGKPFAKYWLHHGLLTINGQKMAKSLRNFISVKKFLKEYTYPSILKLFFLSAHYRSPVDYNEKRIREAKKNYESFQILFDKLNRRFSKEKTPPKRVKQDKDLVKFKRRFEEAMDDDFNTPEALAVLFDLVNFCNKLLDDYDEKYRDNLRAARKLLEESNGIFGIEKSKTFGIKSDFRMLKIESLVKSREDLRKKDNFAEADRIRKRLEEKGIILEDTKEGTVWREKI